MWKPPPQDFIARGFESLVSCSAHPTSPRWSATLPYVFSTQLMVSTFPTGLDECLFNSLVVRIPCSLIFWHFWLFIVFKLVVILVMVVWGSKAFVPIHPPWPEPNNQLFSKASQEFLKGSQIWEQLTTPCYLPIWLLLCDSGKLWHLWVIY